ncbi:hypothetical protein LK488_17875, partial [Fusicatenibacter saccharivorans]
KCTYYYLHAIKMSVNDKTKLEAYEELIAGLQRENKIQNQLIEAQSTMIQTLEEHNAELEKLSVNCPMFK